MRLGQDLAQNLVPDAPPAGPGRGQCSVDFNGERQSWSDNREDNSPSTPEGKSKRDCQHRGKTGKLEPGRQKLQEGAEREGERLGKR